jgi:hypothetical protein
VRVPAALGYCIYTNVLEAGAPGSTGLRAAQAFVFQLLDQLEQDGKNVFNLKLNP